MSKQALRKPKVLLRDTRESKKKNYDQKLIILTLKNDIKLVLSCDSLNGIIMMGDKYRCVVCNVDMHMHSSKEQHKGLIEHKKNLKQYPYIDELSENLIRPVNEVNFYCTICNVVTSAMSITRHIQTEGHTNELSRALTRGSTYKPIV